MTFPARQAEIANLTRQQAQLHATLANRREEKRQAKERIHQLSAQLDGARDTIDATHAAIAELSASASDEGARLDELRNQLQAAASQNKRQLAATLRGVQLLRGPDGPDPKLLSMSQLHMLGEVLSALFDRLHARDAEGGEREDALCELLKGHGIPLPGAVIAPHVKPNGLSAPTAMVPAEAAFEAAVVTPRA